MARVSLSSVRAYLVALVLLASLPGLGITLYTAMEQRRIAAVQAEEDTLRLVRLVAVHETRLIEGARQFLLALAELPQVRSGDSAACTTLFVDLLARYPLYSNFGAVTAKGEVFCSALPFRGPLNVADYAYFRRAMQTRDFSIGDYQTDRITGEPNVVFASPVLDEAGRVRAVVVATLHLAWLTRLASEVRLPEGAALLVTDSNGKILAYYPDAERWVGQSVPEAPLVKGILAQYGEGVIEAPGVDGVPRLFGFTTLPGAPGSAGVYTSIGIPTTVVFAEANRLLVRNLIALGLAVIVALGAAWLGGVWFIMRQARALANTTRRLGAGDLSARTELSYGVGELRQLAHDFNTMAEALQEQQAETQRAEAALREEVQLSTTLVKELEQANRLKTDFLATISHELRTPIYIIMGYLDLLREGDYGPLAREQLEVLERVAQATRELLDLVTATLSINRLEAGRLAVEIQEVAMAEFIEELKLETARERDRSGLNFGWHVAPDLPLMCTDRTKLKIILKNLIGNALKYTDNGGVSVNVTAVDGGVEFRVSDTGIGIAREELPVIFEMFQQARNAKVRQQRGVGLGLYIVRRMLDLMGGTITVESEVGRGSLFRVWVPNVQEHPDESCENEGRSSGGNNKPLH